MRLFPSDVTIAGCIGACKSDGYSMAGMEYGGECVRLYIPNQVY